jgi:hypothetical protein
VVRYGVVDLATEVCTEGRASLKLRVIFFLDGTFM